MIQPLQGFVLIEPLDEETQTASGLLLPEKAKEKPAKGTVIAVGKPIIHYEVGTYTEEPCPVQVGDTIIFHKWSTQTIKEGQSEYLLVHFKDLQALWKP